MTSKPTRCTVCGVSIQQKPTGRPRRYCEECSLAAARARRAVWTRLYRRRNRFDSQPNEGVDANASR